MESNGVSTAAAAVSVIVALIIGLGAMYAAAPSLIGVSTVTSVSTSTVAASSGALQYKYVAAPSWLANDSAGYTNAPQGTVLQFVNLTETQSGYTFTGALWQPQGGTPSKEIAFIMVHGGPGGSFADDSPIAPLQKTFAANYSYASFAYNTRYSTFSEGNAIAKGQNANFLDTLTDLSAAVQFMESLGYQKIIVTGHSLGTATVTTWAAMNEDSHVVGVLLLSAFANLPWKSLHVLLGDNTTWYNIETQYAEKYLSEGLGTELMQGPGFTCDGQVGTHCPMTAIQWMTYRNINTSIAVTTFWIRFVHVPVLNVRDSGDLIIKPYEPGWISGNATASGSRVPSYRFVLVNDPYGPNQGGHGFVHTMTNLTSTITSWMSQQGFT